jgi:hypothetical protein
MDARGGRDGELANAGGGLQSDVSCLVVVLQFNSTGVFGALGGEGMALIKVSP